MKVNKSLKPRNHIAIAMSSRRGGTHQKTNKALRANDKVWLKQQLKEKFDV